MAEAVLKHPWTRPQLGKLVVTTPVYKKPSIERQPALPGSLAAQVDLSASLPTDPPHVTGDQYLQDHKNARVDERLGDWSPDAPENGWSDFWPALGETVAGASYLEQKAKPHTDSDSSEQSPWRDDPTKTCGEAGIGRFAITGSDATGTHQVGKVIYCGREWCSRCGVNSEPNRPGSDSHQRRIARWLPKATQLSTMGYMVLTLPEELRTHARNPENLSALGRKLTRLMNRNGLTRGLRRWHWFGEEENARDGEAPRYHPHQNLLLDAGFIEPERLQKIHDGWNTIVRNTFNLNYTPVTVINYRYSSTPAEMYHKVRYVTRATFKNLQWDEYMGRELLGFRNAQAWGRWEDTQQWQPEPEDNAPTDAAQAVAAGNCPDCDDSPILWQSQIIRAAVLSDTRWRNIGTGFYVRTLDMPLVVKGSRGSVFEKNRCDT